MKIRMIPCECPCGTLIPEFDKYGKKRRFVNGHQNRGINRPDFSGENNPNYGKRGENSPNYGKHHSPETKQLMSVAKLDKYCGENNPFFGKKHSPETKQLMSENRIGKYCGENHPMYGKHLSPETKQKIKENQPDISGANNPNWQGGISKLLYCPIWTPWFKKEIKERDNHQCKNPDCDKEITKINDLNVHHIDYDKKNCSTDNLITLCRSCNSKANHNREHWTNFYNKISKTKIS